MTERCAAMNISVDGERATAVRSAWRPRSHEAGDPTACTTRRALRNGHEACALRPLAISNGECASLRGGDA
ncbi:hypothetical protein WS48_21965 [Burkholderia sp. RF7-non_BP1]|nr:hypothetical protein WS48_21965 [Burkholderia sp. RF7-non_BP1]KUY97624.1 hypothetical protein WS49_20990 [Burkholderia sp. RF7-non_BP4]